MLRRNFLPLAAAPFLPAAVSVQRKNPNVILILADDIGYGDFSCYGATRVKTPNVDRIASRGIRFTDAHSAAATCTPTRYSLMTGEYAFRKKGTAILPGDANLIIDPGRTTLPSVFQSAGYATGAVGKWHLGLGNGPINWNRELTPGPNQIGFDYSFIMPATGDRVPCVYMENGRVVNLDPKDPITVHYRYKVGDWPTGRERPDLLKMGLTRGHDFTIVNGISRIGYMHGGKAALWKDEDMADTFATKAVNFIEKNKQRPFFLYFASHDIHVPRVPHPRFAKTAQCGVRCDALKSFDDSVGKILRTLDKNKLTDDTLIILTSDNGPVLDDGYADRAVEDLNGHTPAGPLRGGKATIFEGGTRVPFLTCWPRRIKPRTSNALVGQYDLVASVAAMFNHRLKPDAAPDSHNVLPALLGESEHGRDFLIEHAGATLALREGTWKFVDRHNPDAPELYNLSDDLAEKNNLAASRAERAAAMRKRLAELQSAGRSRPSGSLR